MRSLFAILLIFSLGIPAHAQSLPERTGFDWLLGISPSTNDFIREVALGELFEIGCRDQRQCKTKAFAAAMLKEHRQTTAQLKALVQSGRIKVTYPTALDDAARRPAREIAVAQRL